MTETLEYLCEREGRVLTDGTLSVSWRDGELCMYVQFQDGLWWEVPFDPEAQDIIHGRTQTRH